MDTYDGMSKTGKKVIYKRVTLKLYKYNLTKTYTSVILEVQLSSGFNYDFLIALAFIRVCS